MLTFSTDGIGGLVLRYSGDLLDAVQTLPASVLNPTTLTYCRFSAGVTGLVTGTQLTGQTSSAVIIVENVVITAGTLGTSDAVGILFYTLVSGTLQADENLRNATPTTLAVSRTAQYNLPREANFGAKSVLLVVSTNTVNVDPTNSIPTNSAETGDTDWGLPLPAGQTYYCRGWQNCKQLKWINAASASNAVVYVCVYYGGIE